MPRALTNLDLDLVRTFCTIIASGSFTQAAGRLRLQQSTVSLQIKRLEDSVGSTLLDRSGRSIQLTPSGEQFLDYASRLLELNDEAVARVSEPLIAGSVRLGAPEDFATRHLPDVLSRFAHAYPAVALEVTCDLTLNLLDGFGKGQFDLALVKRERSAALGAMRVWREPLVWVSSTRNLPERSVPLALVVSPVPCVYRKRAIDALDRQRRKWRVSYTCGSLAGSIAAVKAGLGVTVLPKDMVPPGLETFDGKQLPDLKDTEIALLEAPRISAAAKRLGEHIVRCLEQGPSQTN
jgi:DNA-binding transcriptional LysR family regulator